MIESSSRYDIQITDEYEQLNLDFILEKSKTRIIRGVIWNDEDEPKVVNEAVVLIYLPGEKYFDDNPNDIKCVDYVIPNYNGEFVVGPFEVGKTIILKIFNTTSKAYLLSNVPEEYKYIMGEYDNLEDDKSKEDIDEVSNKNENIILE